MGRLNSYKFVNILFYMNNIYMAHTRRNNHTYKNRKNTNNKTTNNKTVNNKTAINKTIDNKSKKRVFTRKDYNSGAVC
jgi:hypothetical protein